MAMSAGPSGDDKPMSDINTTPLVDVMLVLLIIFLIAVPVVIQTVDLKLPEVRHDPTTTKPENVSLSVKASPDGTCEVYWNMTRVTNDELLSFTDNVALALRVQGSTAQEASGALIASPRRCSRFAPRAVAPS